MPADAIPDFVPTDLQRLGVLLSGDQLRLLSRYLDLLLQANQEFNLTAVRDRDAAWRRHILDSLTLLPFVADLPPDARVIDVGSGGGLPGIPLAVARPDLQIVLLEATAKKARFLQRCAAELPMPNISVLTARAETTGRDKAYRQKFDAAVCRAVGPMGELLEYTLPLVKVGGRLLAMKGPKVEAELDAAADAMAILGAGDLSIEPAYPEGFDMDAVIIRVSKDRPTPKDYPRLPGVPRQSPL